MRCVVAFLMLMLAQPGFAAVCRDIEFEQAAYSVCDVAIGEDLRLFLSAPDSDTEADVPLGNFAAVDAMLAAQGEALEFAMNAGMYHRDRSPVGLYIEAGTAVSPLITRDVPDNFGLLPNGVFCIGATFAVIESRAYAANPPVCRHASQSGPMLVIDGALHPRLIPDSDSFNIRNGVGVSADGARAVFAISNSAVNFHTFARLFRDALGLPNALYFDGSISRLYAPALGRHDGGFPMGPIVGTVVPKG